MASNPQTGDILECKQCNCKVQVIQACECDPGCAEFRCCDQAMENATESAVRIAGNDQVGNGMDPTEGLS
jgi:hypothetical protein